MADPSLAKAPSVLQDDTLPTSHAPSLAEPRKWYRSSLFNAFVIGGVGFMAPGLWNAMNDLGAGGALDPFLVNAANALVFGIMGFLCLFGAPIANRIGLANTLLLGAVGYPIYSAGECWVSWWSMRRRLANVHQGSTATTNSATSGSCSSAL
jgi:hypothetical protein